MDAIERPFICCASMSDALYLPSVLFVAADEEPRCREYLLSGKVVTMSGVSASGRPRQLSGMISGIHRGSLLRPGYPLMLTIRERIDLSEG
jgi:hypothetical protein